MAKLAKRSEPKGGTKGHHVHIPCHADDMQSTLPLGGFLEGAWMLRKSEKSARKSKGNVVV